jgi:hypothetical protein
MFVCDGHNRLMDAPQTKIIELLREVHLLAVKEIEKLTCGFVELENEHPQQARAPVVKPSANANQVTPPAISKPNEMMTKRQVAEYMNVSLGSFADYCTAQ